MEPPKVKLYHWWPGRTWRGPCPIPALVQIAEQRGSVYMTVALDEDWAGVAFCRRGDTPSRKMGRDIALGRCMARPNYIILSRDRVAANL